MHCNWLNVKDGNIALFLALETGNHGICRELLSVLAKEQTAIKRADTGDTAIHLAMKKKDIEMLRLLVDCGGSVDAQNVNMFAFHSQLIRFALSERRPDGTPLRRDHRRGAVHQISPSSGRKTEHSGQVAAHTSAFGHWEWTHEGGRLLNREVQSVSAWEDKGLHFHLR